MKVMVLCHYCGDVAGFTDGREPVLKRRVGVISFPDLGYQIDQEGRAACADCWDEVMACRLMCYSHQRQRARSSHRSQTGEPGPWQENAVRALEDGLSVRE